MFSTAVLAVLLQCAAAQLRLPPGYDTRRIPCDSVLVQLRPSNFPHCKCTYGDWSNWEYEEHVDDTSGKCPSGRKFILKQTDPPSPLPAQMVHRPIVAKSVSIQHYWLPNVTQDTHAVLILAKGGMQCA